MIIFNRPPRKSGSLNDGGFKNRKESYTGRCRSRITRTNFGES